MQFGFPHDNKFLPFIESGPKATQSSAWPCFMENIQCYLEGEPMFWWTGGKYWVMSICLLALWEGFIYHTWLKCLIPGGNECIGTYNRQEGIIPTAHQMLIKCTFSLTIYFHLGVANREYRRDSNNGYEPKLKKWSMVWNLSFGKYIRVANFLVLQ